jgi:integrase
MDMVHNYNQKREYWLKRVDALNDSDKEIVKGFASALRIHGVGLAREACYTQYSYEILKMKQDLKIEKSIKGFNRDDVDKIANAITNSKKWSYITIATALRTLKRLIHYAKHREIADGNNTKYCYEVEHIHPDRYHRKAVQEEKIKATDLLTKEEFLKMVDKVYAVSRYPKRDKALLYVMYEFASRPSELLNIVERYRLRFSRKDVDAIVELNFAKKSAKAFEVEVLSKIASRFGASRIDCKEVLRWI